MKIIDDNGNEVKDLGDQDAFVIFRPDGKIDMWMPEGEDNEIVPDYVLAATGTFLYLHEGDGRESMKRFFISKQRTAS